MTQPKNIDTNCNHQFWKDRNPENCFNCGKTYEEIYKQNNKQYWLGKVLGEVEEMKQTERDIRPNAIFDGEAETDLNKALSTLKSYIEKLMKE